MTDNTFVATNQRELYVTATPGQHLALAVAGYDGPNYWGDYQLSEAAARGWRVQLVAASVCKVARGDVAPWYVRVIAPYGTLMDERPFADPAEAAGWALTTYRRYTA